MVLFDSTFLIVLLQPNAPPPVDRDGKVIAGGAERISNLIKALSKEKTVVCVPAPVVAEVMALGGRGGSKYLEEMRKII